MKILPSVAFNDFSGSAGQVTARKVGDKTYLSTRTKHSRKTTPSQASIRCRFGNTNIGYSKLTEGQRLGWSYLASSLGEYATSTGNTTITGHNLFVSINTFRSICGKPITRSAPAQLLPSRYINVGDIWLTPEHVIFANVALIEGTDDVVLFEMFAAKSPAETNAWDKTSIVAVVASTDWGEVDLTKAYLEKFGIPIKIGQRIYIKVCKLNSECGYVKWFSLHAYFASERSTLHQRLYIPRAKIKMEMINPITQNYECDEIDYEISPGPKITSNNITVRSLQDFLVTCDFLHNGLTDAFDFERSYQYSRSPAERNYFIQCMEVKVYNNSTKKISLYCFAGVYTKHFETFGTYFITN